MPCSCHCSNLPFRSQSNFKFPEQSGSHRIPGKQVHRLLNPFAVWSTTVSLFHPIHLLDPPVDLFSFYPTPWNFSLEKRKTHTARCNMELWGETATCPFHSRCVASFLGGVGSSQPELSGNPCLFWCTLIQLCFISHCWSQLNIFFKTDDPAIFSGVTFYL